MAEKEDFCKLLLVVLDVLLEKLVDDEAEAKLAVDLDSCWKLELEADAALVEKVCC